MIESHFSIIVANTTASNYIQIPTMSDKQKDGDTAEKAASPSSNDEDLIMAKSKKWRIVEFTLFMLFFLTAITHSYVQTS